MPALCFVCQTEKGTFHFPSHYDKLEKWLSSLGLTSKPTKTVLTTVNASPTTIATTTAAATETTKSATTVTGMKGNSVQQN